MMRQRFGEYLYKQMLTDDKIFVVTADLGFGLWNRIRDVFPERFINYGAAEMGALAFCVGLSYQGYKPVFYSIAPFAMWRPAEIIRNYLNHEQAKVLIALSGRDKDYEHDGFSHNATDIPGLTELFPNVEYFEPVEEDVEAFTQTALDNLPAIISLSR